ncbi:hypothetical protein ACE6H2_018866 [Prunus campanulata]
MFIQKELKIFYSTQRESIMIHSFTLRRMGLMSSAIQNCHLRKPLMIARELTTTITTSITFNEPSSTVSMLRDSLHGLCWTILNGIVVTLFDSV